MELGDYWRLIRRWWAFLLLCTILAALVGEYLAHRSAAASTATYDGTATVLVNYVTPNGAPYNPTLSKQDVTVALSNRVKDPNVVQTVRNRYHLDRSTVSSVTAATALDAAVITVHAIGTSSTAAETFATGTAEELAALHTQQLTAEADGLHHQLGLKVTAARDKYLSTQRQYYHVCGCIGGQTRPLVSQTTLENIQANLSILQQTYESARSDYNSLTVGPVPPAAASPGSVREVSSSSSAIKTVLPAAILGFLLAFGLAALIDYIRDLPFFVRKRALQAEGPVVVSIEFKLRQRRDHEARTNSQSQGRLAGPNEDAPEGLARLASGAGGDSH